MWCQVITGLMWNLGFFYYLHCFMWKLVHIFHNWRIISPMCTAMFSCVFSNLLLFWTHITCLTLAKILCEIHCDSSMSRESKIILWLGEFIHIWKHAHLCIQVSKSADLNSLHANILNRKRVIFGFKFIFCSRTWIVLSLFN